MGYVVREIKFWAKTTKNYYKWQGWFYMNSMQYIIGKGRIGSITEVVEDYLTNLKHWGLF